MRPEAVDQLNQALVLTSNTGARRLTWQLLALQAQYESAAGRHDEAHARYVEAGQIIEYIAAHAGDESLRDAFLSRTDVTEILNAAR